MRTTLDLDPDVLEAVREIAARRRTGVGTVLSELARQALTAGEGGQEVRNGAPLLPPRPGAQRVTREAVNRLRDEGP